MKPTLETMRALVVADPNLFTEQLAKFGLKSIGKINNDPLNKIVQAETVQSIASIITESVNEYVEISKDTMTIKKLAESYGYIVEIL